MNLKKSLLKIKLKTVIVFLSLSLFPSLANSDNPYLASSDPSNYTCQINKECLNYLDNTLLNKTSDRGIYKYCSDKYENIKLCCVNPLECRESYGRNKSNELKNNSLNEVEESGTDVLSCHLNQLSSLISSLSGVQSEFCNMGINVCKEDCLSKLQEVKDSFRECFSIADSYNISAILEKARSSTKDQDCYKEMIDIADKYKRQSLNKLSLLREDLKSQDIIDCEGIKEVKTTKSLNNLAQNVCHQAKAQKEEKIQQEEAQAEQERQQAELERQQLEAEQAQELNQATPTSQDSVAGSALLGVGVAGTGIIDDSTTSENKDKSNKKTSQNKQSVSKKTEASSDIGKSSIETSSQNQNKKTTTLENKKTSNEESSVSSSLTPSQLNASSKDNTQLAFASPTSICPVSMPEIKSAVLFQSVEAPQIEPMDEQENAPYDNYDLVMGKPAGVLVQLDKANMDREKRFFLALNIEGDSNYRYDCFHQPLSELMEKGKEESCYFTKLHLEKEGLFKFLPLPMNERILQEEKSFKSTLALFPRNYNTNPDCVKYRSFNSRIIKTKNLKLGFTRIFGGRNCAYTSTRFSTVQGIANSDELKNYIPSMFPVARVDSRILEYSFKGVDYDYTDGNCDNTRYDIANESIGLLKDIDHLEYVRAQLDYDKLIAVVPDTYFKFHGKDDHDQRTEGFIISPLWEEKGFWGNKIGFLGGSWNIAFILDDQKDEGTVAHELAHTLGQGREFYKDENKKLHEQEMCQQFKGSNTTPCYKYKVQLGLDYWKDGLDKFWQFVIKKFSIMNNKNDIAVQWIDRDTYQKTFKVLSERAVIPADEELFGESIVRSPLKKEKKTSIKAVVSGFYYEREKAFVAPQIKIRKTKLLTTSFFPNTENTKLPVVTFQLKERNKILQKIKRPLFKMQIKTLYKNKAPETKPFDFSPVRAIFKLPSNSQKRNLRIEVLDPEGDMIYTAFIPRRQKKKKESKENIALIDKFQ